MRFNPFKPPSTELSDEALMGLIAVHGNESAFEILYERYYKKLIWFSMRLLGSQEQAEDIVQDTFMKIIDRPELFSRVMKFSTWVYTLVNNASLSVLKNESNRSRLINENYSDIKFTTINSKIDADIIRQQINKIYKTLNEKEQLIFILRFEMELSIKEISEIAKIPEGSVKSCLFYLLKKLSSLIKSKEKSN